MKPSGRFATVALAAVAAAYGVLMGDALATGLVLFAVGHCDTIDGPVVTLARRALDAGNVNLVLPWVRKEDEAQIRHAFDHASAAQMLAVDRTHWWFRSKAAYVATALARTHGPPQDGGWLADVGVGLRVLSARAAATTLSKLAVPAAKSAQRLSAIASASRGGRFGAVAMSRSQAAASSL